MIVTARKAEGAQGIDQAVVKLNALPNIKGKAVGLPGNVAQLEDTERLLAEVKKLTSELHILVANAGATWGGPFEPTPDWSSQKILDLNVRGVFNLARLSVLCLFVYMMVSVTDFLKLTDVYLDLHPFFQPQQLRSTQHA